MHWLDILIIFCLGLSLWNGYKQGVVGQVLSLLALLLALVFSGQIVPTIYGFIEPHIGNQLGMLLAWVVAFLLILITVSIVGRFIDSLVKSTFGMLGNILGALLSFVVCFAFIGFMGHLYLNVMVPLGFPPTPEESVLFPQLVALIETLLPNYLLQLKEFDSSLLPTDSLNVM